MSNLWQSARLIYRSLESEDESFLETLRLDADAFMNATSSLPVPQGKKQATALREALDGKLLTAVICLPESSVPKPAVDETLPKPLPIGVVSLAAIDVQCIQHRRTALGVNIVRSYQGQGYGTEAIEWALNWGFQYAGLHRIEINAFAYNTGAVQLYQRMGFVQEGRKRDFVFHNGKFWDSVSFSMLENEWRQRMDNNK